VGNAEIVGVDLNFALLQRGRATRDIPRFHLVIASLFHLPFRQESFDLVYSQGVIHHTYSTKAAFDSISRFVREDGHLFIWVYALDSHLLPEGYKGFILRTKRIAETVFRPLVSRAPGPVREVIFWALTTALHPFIRRVVRHQDKWTRKNSDHGLRDWLSPRYAHRHSYNQVLEWFEDSGYEIAGLQSPKTYRRLFLKQLYGVGVLGRRTATGQLETSCVGEAELHEPRPMRQHLIETSDPALHGDSPSVTPCH
jgi:ubiquinone/menaquinone biosynthesis C-methylase UbiE